MSATVLVVAIIVGGSILIAHLLVTCREWFGGWARRFRVALLLVPFGVWWAWQQSLLPLPLLLVVFIVIGVLIWRHVVHNAQVVRRLGQRARRKHGVASWVDILRHGSVWRVRRKARILRPSLAGLRWWQLYRIPRTEYACRVARSGLFWVWTNVEYVTLVFGGPRRGKSGYLGSRILDAPGMVLATSTRADLYLATAAKRRERGPVYVFNPVGLGDLPSSLQFDPLVGCEDPDAAYQRATDLLGVSGENDRGSGDEHGYWENQARRVLTALLHAAAIGGRTMLDVYRWVADPDAHKTEIMRLLLRGNVAAYVPDVEQFVSTNHETRSSITTGVTPGLGWLTAKPALRATRPGSKLDVEALLAERATIYLIGDEETQSSPLVRALTGFITREARRIAGRSRLDPPLTLTLDEAGQLAPPLPKWTADMGGRGVTIVAVFQSRAQMLTRYTGPESGTIQNNAGTTVLFGGTGDEADLRYWSMRVGNRDEPVVTTDLHGKVTSRTVRKVPVLEANQINALPEFRVIVFHGGMPPMLGRAQMSWEHPEIRRGSLRNRYARLRAWLQARLGLSPTHQQPEDTPEATTEKAA